jgi:GMP synthase (glutamine-hydrolysing)
LRHRERPIYGVQFHPEVTHTSTAARSTRTSSSACATRAPTGRCENFVDTWLPRIRERVGSRRVICGLSGGVDSTVVAAAHPSRDRRPADVHLRRQRPPARGEAEQVASIFRDRMELDVRVVDASARFLKNLRDVEDPERSAHHRRHVHRGVRGGGAKIPDADFLAQGRSTRT